jgi:hypothetical protein
MLEVVFQFKLRRLQARRWRERRYFRRERRKLETRADAGEALPLVGKRDPIDASHIHEEAAVRLVNDEINVLITTHLLDQAERFIVPSPEPNDKDSWTKDYAGHFHLTMAAIARIRSDIRNERKARWEYWQGRVTLALAIVGSIFGVVAYFRR